MDAIKQQWLAQHQTDRDEIARLNQALFERNDRSIDNLKVGPPGENLFVCVRVCVRVCACLCTNMCVPLASLTSNRPLSLLSPHNSFTSPPSSPPLTLLPLLQPSPTSFPLPIVRRGCSAACPTPSRATSSWSRCACFARSGRTRSACCGTSSSRRTRRSRCSDRATRTRCAQGRGGRGQWHGMRAGGGRGRRWTRSKEAPHDLTPDLPLPHLCILPCPSILSCSPPLWQIRGLEQEIDRLKAELERPRDDAPSRVLADRLAAELRRKDERLRKLDAAVKTIQGELAEALKRKADE
jgi:hypothetical protein